MATYLNGQNILAANHAYYQNLAALLEPDAIEPLQHAATGGNFTYTVGAAETKYILASFNTRLGAGGRWEVRDPRKPVPLRNIALYGGVAAGTEATAIILDPTVPNYVDARARYFDRLQALNTLNTKVLNITAPSTYVPFLPGAYGAIITQVANFDFTWVIGRWSTRGFNLANEMGDAGATDYQRNANALLLPVNKKVINGIESGPERSAGVGLASVSYVLLPSTWSVVSDPNSYNFRDDFMGASLDTAATWTRAQSVAGNVEIDTAYQWLKALGTVTWGQNAAYSQSSIARSAGKIFLIDVYTGNNATANNSHMVGFSDGGGHSYTNFSHGVLFTSTGAANQMKVYENGNDRGAVGSAYTAKCMYRVRITLGASNAAYAIQGGTEYQAIGSAAWTDITPGTTSSSTTPLHAGVSVGATGTMYMGDARIY